MHVRTLLINQVSLLAGGPSPFDSGADELEFYDRRRQNWYRENKDFFEHNIRELLIEKVVQQEIEPLPIDFFEDECIELIRLILDLEIRNGLYALVVSTFSTSTNKAFDLDVLAELNQPGLLNFLIGIEYASLTKSELLSYIHAVGETRAPEGIMLLTAIESNDLDVVNEISIARAVISSGKFE